MIKSELSIQTRKQVRAKMLWVLPSSLFFFIIVPMLTFYISQYIEKILEIEQLLGKSSIYIGVPLLVYGAYFILESIRILYMKGDGVPLGDLIPEEQTRALVIDGVYNKTRNPMLFGYLTSLIGLGFILKSTIISSLLRVVDYLDKKL